ncbi:type II toxin-antitoxin system HicB family antitoxin [Microbaculum marinum]|uniref:Type II toxin-antitoxin system HicB family antitoxin n=1 Tax=Microbaculum marinum TaxID=1764581 RepID=A0AAW9RN78_9HYPH
MRYVVVVDGDPGSFGVWVPDMPGCTSGGDTPEEALANAQEALRLWAETAEADGETVPLPRSIDKVRADQEVREALAEGAFLASVPLVRSTGRPTRINVSLDSGVVDAIDAAARIAGTTRSGYLATAAREKIAREG